MSLPVCPENCDDNLPVFEFNECNPEINNGEIAYIYYTTDEDGTELQNAGDPAELDSRLSQSASTPGAIRTLRVLGDMPPVGDNEKPISGGRIVNGVLDYIINFDIDETNQINHDAVRASQCNTGSKRVWFETRDKKFFGGNSGIRNATINIKLNVPREYNDIITFPGTVKWKDKFIPERQASVITDAMRNQ